MKLEKVTFLFGLELNIQLRKFKEDNVFIVYWEVLDVSGYDYTPEGAMESFKIMVNEYLGI